MNNQQITSHLCKVTYITHACSYGCIVHMYACIIYVVCEHNVCMYVVFVYVCTYVHEHVFLKMHGH